MFMIALVCALNDFFLFLLQRFRHFLTFESLAVTGEFRIEVVGADLLVMLVGIRE